MSKSLPRKIISEDKKKKDFIQTHPTMAKVLLNWLITKGYSKDLRVLDPCCGKGVICDVLSHYFTDVKSFDKYMGDNREDFLKHNDTYDLITMNCPYSNKYNFINHAREIATTVIALFPLNISNYNIIHQHYEDIPEYVGRIKMTPKVKLTESQEFEIGGNSTYCWYIWDRHNNTDHGKEWYDDLRKYLWLMGLM